MTAYLRSRLASGCYFFTLALADRRSYLLTEKIDRLRNCIRRVNRRHPFTIEAIVVLPDRLHCLWTLTQNDADYSMRWNLIKGTFSRGIAAGEIRSNSRGERGIWQRRFWEHVIRNERDYANHVAYIHINPVKHGLVQRAADWPHSSIHTTSATGFATRHGHLHLEFE